MAVGDLGREADGNLKVMGEALPGCALVLDASLADRPYSEVCPVVLHEVGHLAGFGHSPNPASIMYFTAPLVRGCRGCAGPSA